ncbi:ribonuclease HII [Patescibacteria group bacterium]|nr:ribonuclease HII [Patescibacteria group bacterium]
MVYPTIDLEKKLWKKGFKIVVGIDEAGRGPLAGPVVAGCVCITSKKQVVDSVRDSKKMTERQRNIAFELIKEKSEGYGVGIVEAKRIDKVGIRQAVLEAMTEAVKETEKMLKEKVEYIIADGGIILIEGYEMESIEKGDLNHYSIAAGSVLAKVTRDRIMNQYANQFPKYGFEKHMGYGTKLHMDMIKKYGACEIHRLSFAPFNSKPID